MIKIVKEFSENSFEWIDLTAPTEEELTGLAAKYNLPETALKDCLQPDHLPKFEPFENVSFIIVRNFDSNCPIDSDSIQQLTRKIAIFYSDAFLITVHRSESNAIKNTTERYLQKNIGKNPFDIICKIMKEALETYETPLNALDKETDFYENRIFLKKRIPDLLKKLYLMKRKAYIFKRLFSLNKSVIEQMVYNRNRNTFYEDMKDYYIRIDTINEEVFDSINSLLNIYISLSSQKTNEVMRVLTAFSAFFLPLTFIVGVYGMNFDYMPELKQAYGYPTVLVSMLALTIIIYQWFKRKGWM